MKLSDANIIELLRSQVASLESMCGALQQSNAHNALVIQRLTRALDEQDAEVADLLDDNAALREQLLTRPVQIIAPETTVPTDPDGDSTGFPMFLDDMRPGLTD